MCKHIPYSIVHIALNSNNKSLLKCKILAVKIKNIFTFSSPWWDQDQNIKRYCRFKNANQVVPGICYDVTSGEELDSYFLLEENISCGGRAVGGKRKKTRSWKASYRVLKCTRFPFGRVRCKRMCFHRNFSWGGVCKYPNSGCHLSELKAALI